MVFFHNIPYPTVSAVLLCCTPGFLQIWVCKETMVQATEVSEPAAGVSVSLRLR